MRIAKVVYDPPGTDTENAETVTLVNRGPTAQLHGFRLRDEAGASYRLPAYRIGRGHHVAIHSGHGSTRPGHLYAGWGFTWNNDGDRAWLLTPSGGTADTCRWGDGSGTTTC
jgi:Lamin Tail Domain